MDIQPFAIEQFFAQYEFSTRYLLCASDCESLRVAELLALAGWPPEALGDLHLGYTESQGDPRLREAVAETYTAVDPLEIVVLGAPEEGIYLTMRALLAPGDHVVVLTPAYDSLLNLAQHITGNVSAWEIQPSEGAWRLDMDRLETLLQPQTKLLVVNFPHNPTGLLPDAETFAALVEMARRRGIWLFCDEMYRGLELGGRKMLPSAADLYERAVVLAGLSKVHGLPGLRAGWLVVRDTALRQSLLNWKFYTTICPPAPTELLARAAVQARTALTARSRALIEANLAEAGQFFTRWLDLFTWRPPQAGSVALAGLAVPSATAYCHALAQKAGVLLLPSSCLGFGDGHVRMGFGRADFAEALHHYETFLVEEAR